MQPASGTLKVLSISPFEDDHLFLQSIIGHSNWNLLKAGDLSSALAYLQQHGISVVVCERDLMPGTWTDVLEHLHEIPHPPSLIVTSTLADERLWVEALNLGAWDVLAKPFNRAEVLRAVKAAWQHRHHRIQLAARSKKLMSAAS